MPLFPSSEWIDAFCEALSADPRSGEVATALHGLYRFTIEPAGPLTERHRYDVMIRSVPEGAQVERVDPPSAGDPRLAISADYERWRGLIRGELDLAFAYMMRRISVSGDVGGLIRSGTSATPLVEALSAVDTQWR